MGGGRRRRHTTGDRPLRSLLPGGPSGGQRRRVGARCGGHGARAPPRTVATAGSSAARPLPRRRRRHLDVSSRGREGGLRGARPLVSPGADGAGGGCFCRWLGIAAAGGPEKPGCASPPLSRRQQDLCKQKPELVPAIREGARLGLQECRSQFRHERWDCRPPPAARRGPAAPPAALPAAAAAFGHQLSSGECPRSPPPPTGVPQFSSPRRGRGAGGPSGRAQGPAGGAGRRSAVVAGGYRIRPGRLTQVHEMPRADKTWQLSFQNYCCLL